MLLSPEALLRHPVPYPWPLSSLKSERHPECHPARSVSEVIMLSWPKLWVAAFDPFITNLRTHRFKRAPVDVLYEEPDDPERSPYSQAILYLANRGGFFVKGTPPLKSTVFETSIDGCLAQSFVLAGPTNQGPIEWMKSGSKPQDTWIDRKKCICVVFLLAPGTLDPIQWTNHRKPPPDSQPDRHLPTIMKCCEEFQTRQAAVTDGNSTIFLELFPRTMFIPFVPGPFYIEAKHVHNEPVQLCIAWLIYKESKASKLWGMHTMREEVDCRGALNAPLCPLPTLETILKQRHFSDFDLYTMQRDRRYWKMFLLWQAAKADEAEAHPLRPNDTLVADKNSFAKAVALLRSPLPVPDIPPETAKRVLSQLRPRDPVASAATSGEHGAICFKVTGAVRTGRDTYSQVLCGVVEHCGMLSRPLCLKLYDERLFATPFYDRSEHDPLFSPGDEKAPDRLLTWNPAEDLARREEAAYDRLQVFQGSFLPHSYGFHHFTFPDKHRCIGFLMEFVDGVSLDKADLKTLSEEAQKEFVLTVRHCLRVLRYAQIEQTDWHVDQFLVRSDSKTCRPEVVFIDFAFAVQHTDPLHTPPTLDWSACRNRLCDVLDWDFVSPLWFEPDENEY